MTVVLEKTTEAPADSEATVRYAPWLTRAGALAFDFLPGIAVVATMALLAIAAPVWNWVWWTFTVVAALAAAATLVNRVVLPTQLGWTLGRAVFGIRAVRPDGSPVGSVRLFGRDLAHLLDTAALFIGWLWPLWDKRSRTFADLLLRTEVRVVDDADAPKRGVRRLAGAVLVGAAVLCAAGGGLGYLQVYQHERAIEQARDQISEQGPRIVEQLLSYGTDSVVDDFARAQSLATDGYRQQLVDQQQSVKKKSGVISNEYWAVSSAVLPA